MSGGLHKKHAVLLAAAAAGGGGGGGGGGGNTGYRGGAVLTNSGGNFSGTAPAGIVAGDAMYAVFFQDAGTTTGSGWSPDASGNTPTNGFPCTVLRKVAAGTEGGTTQTFPTGATVGEGILFVISGANASPVDATTTVGVGTSATITFPDITSAHPNSMHIAVCCNFNALPGVPGGYTPRVNSATWVAADTKVIASAGLITGVTASGGDDEWVAFSILVRSS